MLRYLTWTAETRTGHHNKIFADLITVSLAMPWLKYKFPSAETDA